MLASTTLRLALLSSLVTLGAQAFADGPDTVFKRVGPLSNMGSSVVLVSADAPQKPYDYIVVWIEKSTSAPSARLSTNGSATVYCSHSDASWTAAIPRDLSGNGRDNYFTIENRCPDKKIGTIQFSAMATPVTLAFQGFYRTP